MIETRRWWVREHLVPWLVNGEEPGMSAEDLNELTVAQDDLETLDGGGWSATAEVVSTDEFRVPNSGGVRGRCAQVVISRDVIAPMHVWVGYYVGSEYQVVDSGGRICATEEEANQYIHACQMQLIDERRQEMAGDLHYGLRECLEAVRDAIAGGPWSQGDLQDLLDEHESVEKAYRAAVEAVAWEIGTDGGAKDPTMHAGHHVTGREAIEIHRRNRDTVLLKRVEDGQDREIDEDEAWSIIESDPGAVYVALKIEPSPVMRAAVAAARDS